MRAFVIAWLLALVLGVGLGLFLVTFGEAIGPSDADDSGMLIRLAARSLRLVRTGVGDLVATFSKVAVLIPGHGSRTDCMVC
jgi:hypothetical protein